MNILITGASGFVGSNLLNNIKNDNKYKITIFKREDNYNTFYTKIIKSDIIIHLAGVNRSSQKKDFIDSNYQLTKKIIEILKEKKKKTKLIFASSTQTSVNNAYGQSKKKAEKILIEYNKNYKANILIYRLPNIFGKWSKPYYNSVVATFCFQIARKKKLHISNNNKKITLLYIDDLINQLIKNIHFKKEKKIFAKINNTFRISLEDLAKLIKNFYQKDKINLTSVLKNSYEKKLYSTYISFIPKKDFTYKIKNNSDSRGEFVEFLKHRDLGQISFFSILPGKIRGNHYHNSKIEKFVVIEGVVKFNFVNLLTKEKWSRVIKNRNVGVNTIPGWAHNIENIGSKTAILIVWANEIYNPKNSDTFFYKV